MLAKESEYIPAGDDTIAYTSMIGGGESDQISTVDQPGTYVFLCISRSLSNNERRIYS